LSEEGQNDKINFRKKLNFLRSHKDCHIFKLYDFLVHNMILLVILYKIKNIKIKLSKNQYMQTAICIFFLKATMFFLYQLIHLIILTHKNSIMIQLPKNE